MLILHSSHKLHRFNLIQLRLVFDSISNGCEWLLGSTWNHAPLHSTRSLYFWPTGISLHSLGVVLHCVILPPMIFQRYVAEAWSVCMVWCWKSLSILQNFWGAFMLNSPKNMLFKSFNSPHAVKFDQNLRFHIIICWIIGIFASIHKHIHSSIYINLGQIDEYNSWIPDFVSKITSMPCGQCPFEHIINILEFSCRKEWKCSGLCVKLAKIWVCIISKPHECHIVSMLCCY